MLGLEMLLIVHFMLLSFSLLAPIPHIYIHLLPERTAGVP